MTLEAWNWKFDNQYGCTEDILLSKQDDWQARGKVSSSRVFDKFEASKNSKA